MTARHRWLTTSLAAALLLSACAGSDDDADPGAASTDAAAEESEPDPPEPDGADEPDEADGEAAEDEAVEDEASDDAEDASVEHDQAQPRLAIADAASPTVVYLDLSSGEVVGELVLDEEVLTHGAALTSDGRYLLAPHGSGVSIVDGGTWSEQHGTHAHHYTTPPSLVGWVDGPDPSHLVSAGGLSALFFDGDGDTIVLDEAGFDHGHLDEVATIETGEAHHGFTVPTGEHYVVTVPTDDMEGMPNVVGVADASGEVLRDAPCANTHGEARLPEGAAAACQDGVLLVTGSDDGWDLEHVAYPEVDDEDPYGFGNARAWVLFTPEGSDLLVAPLGARHVLALDPSAASASAVALDEDVALFGVSTDTHGSLLVLTTDGALQTIDPSDGSVTDRAEVIGAFEEGDTAEPYRRLVTTAEHAYVSDPTAGTVVEVALDGLEVTRTFELDVTPGYLGYAPG